MVTRAWARFWLAGAITAASVCGAGCSDSNRRNEDGDSEAGDGGRAGSSSGGRGGDGAGSAGMPQGGSQGETGGNGASAGSTSNGGNDTGGANTGGTNTGGTNPGGASGANTGGSGGSGGSMCGRPQLLLVIDRSISMSDNEVASGVTRWQAVVDGVSAAVTSITSVDWGIKFFPETGNTASSCAFDNVTGLVHLPIAPDTAEAAGELLALTIANGSGTPTGQAIVMAAQYLHTLDSSRPRRLVLITDDTPNCQRTSIEPSPDAGLEYAIEALLACRDGFGYFTYVVGVGVDTESASLDLSYMAEAGGRPFPTMNPLVPLYYAADSAGVIERSLQTIAADAACP